MSNLFSRVADRSLQSAPICLQNFVCHHTIIVRYTYFPLTPNHYATVQCRKTKVVTTQHRYYTFKLVRSYLERVAVQNPVSMCRTQSMVCNWKLNDDETNTYRYSPSFWCTHYYDDDRNIFFDLIADEDTRLYSMPPANILIAKANRVKR